jgi:hypothetical protein
MSYRRRREEWARRRESGGLDDVAAAITDAVDTVSDALSSSTDQSARERRRLEKLEKRRQQAADGRRNLLAVGAGLFAGGLAATLGLITVAAVGVGLLTGGCVAMLLRWIEEAGPDLRLPQRAARPALSDPSIAGQDPRAALIRSVVTAAMVNVRAVDKAAASSTDLETAAILTRIAAIGHRICRAVAAQPALFDNAQRLLTYHAEKAATLADWAASAQGERQIGVRRVLARMELLFEQTEAALKHEDNRELDLELRLINQALDEDLRR